MKIYKIVGRKTLEMLHSQLNVLLCVYSFVTPKSFVFGDEDLIPADCYPEKFNYTFKVSSDVSLTVFSSYRWHSIKNIPPILVIYFVFISLSFDACDLQLMATENSTSPKIRLMVCFLTIKNRFLKRKANIVVYVIIERQLDFIQAVTFSL